MSNVRNTSRKIRTLSRLSDCSTRYPVRNSSAGPGPRVSRIQISNPSESATHSALQPAALRSERPSARRLITSRSSANNTRTHALNATHAAGVPIFFHFPETSRSQSQPEPPVPKTAAACAEKHRVARGRTGTSRRVTKPSLENPDRSTSSTGVACALCGHPAPGHADLPIGHPASPRR